MITTFYPPHHFGGDAMGVYRLANGLEAAYTDVFGDTGSTLHAGAAAQARAALVVRVIAWWADDPERATRDEVVDLLFELDPIRI